VRTGPSPAPTAAVWADATVLGVGLQFFPVLVLAGTGHAVAIGIPLSVASVVSMTVAVLTCWRRARTAQPARVLVYSSVFGALFGVGVLLTWMVSGFTVFAGAIWPWIVLLTVPTGGHPGPKIAA
jgi:hypothetical protein